MNIVEKKDLVSNAVIVGMSLEDAYVYAGLTPSEITTLEHDDDFQRQMHQQSRELERQLLVQMRQIADRQVRLGKENATAWLLEKLYPRYSSKPQESTAPITINLGQNDPASLDTVTINNGHGTEPKPVAANTVTISKPANE